MKQAGLNPDDPADMARTLRHLLAAAAAGLIVSAVVAQPPAGLNPWAVVRHPGRQTTVAPVHEQHPIDYPRSALAAADDGSERPEDRLLREFFDLHTAMAYEQAAVVADQMVELSPDSPQAHYNRACVMGRLHRAEPALDSLQRAVDLGWHDLVHMSIDTDLDCVRHTPRYRALVSRLRQTLAAQDNAGAPSVWSERIAELYRQVPRLLAGGGDPSASVAIIDGGRMVWTATIALGPARLVANHDADGRLPARPLTQLASCGGWDDIIRLLGLDNAGDEQPQAAVRDLVRPVGGGILLLRRTPGLGSGVVVVAGDREIAGRIAAVALGQPADLRVSGTVDGNRRRESQ